MSLQWSDKLAAWTELNVREIAAFEAASLLRIGDLLRRLPRRYEDRRCSLSLSEFSHGQTGCLRLHVYSCGWRFSFKRYFEAVLGEENSSLGSRLYLRWFHAPYIAKMIATGQNLYVYGQAKDYAGKLCIVNPDFEVVDDDSGMRLAELALGGSLEGAAEPVAGSVLTPQEPQLLHSNRIVPIYKALSGVTPRRYREIMWKIIQELNPEIRPSYYDVASSYPLAEALRDAHFPEELDKSRKARLRFALAECFVQQFKVQWRRRCSQRKQGQQTATTRYYLEQLHEALPFTLTSAQLRSIAEIEADMRQPTVMNRLLQGDVGSGKTLVALSAMLLAIESGKSAALIAPTQILAEQHYAQFCRLLKGMDIPISLRTSSRKEDSELIELQQDNINDGARIIVGTHALLYKKNRPKALGLAVIDEQHKFGVEQREQFIALDSPPDLLVMTATPIPRTLTLSIYGDLDVSIIDELPANRGSITTALRSPKQMKKIISFMRSELEAGRQIYIVSPLVAESEKRAQASATAEFERWCAEFPDYSLGLLHGRLSAEEKDAVMSAFRTNDSSILVATTVIEVGVDVANATVMLINDADAFGLSQLHQLRGRIGRGEHKSYCILLSEAKLADPAWEKLDVLCRSNNGFVIAEEDFRLRGPGDVLGKAQSGLGAIEFPEWLSDSRLIHRANREASEILDADPDLLRPEHMGLRNLIAEQIEQAVTA